MDTERLKRQSFIDQVRTATEECALNNIERTEDLYMRLDNIIANNDLYAQQFSENEMKSIYAFAYMYLMEMMYRLTGKNDLEVENE